MSKRSLSPAPLPPSKRVHTASEDHPLASLETLPTFDNLLSDEIVLFIFSYLSPADLCAVQRTNRNWSRLSLDNQLWKSLYISEYGRTRLRGARGFIGRGDGREIKPLPGRAKSEDVKDWKWMFRISSNWRTGRCSLEHFALGIPPRLFSSVQAPEQTHLLLAGSLTIMASSKTTTLPNVLLSSPGHSPHTLPCPSHRPGVGTHITAIALDQSPPTSGHHGRLVAFLSTGEFNVFSINHRTPSSSKRLFAYQPSTANSRSTPIIQAVYHHPLLVTLSESFRLSLYDLSSDTVRHTQTLTSFTSYPPSSLVLSSQSPSTYKLVLAYAIPVYPSHWSVGATELIISTSEGSRMTVASTRTARAIDVPQGWLDEQKMRAVREQWGRKVARVADTQTDGKWVVLAPGQHLPSSPASEDATPSASTDASPSSTPPSSPSSSSGTTYTSSSLYTASGLQLYRLYFPSSSSGSSSPKLTFVRTLHGQIGPVSTLALADGRCVSLGMNGSIWVWDLEAGTGTEVTPGVTGPTSDDGEDADGEDGVADALEVVKMRVATGARGSVVFDDRRIVSSHGSEVEVRRFDI
ncbi:hypothetical protein OH77DRAFT_1418923 [Trametes cingulata]|nr:hypothetical protein OH77DRAFT_1418923 [Trametes cingulata]